MARRLVGVTDEGINIIILAKCKFSPILISTSRCALVPPKELKMFQGGAVTLAAARLVRLSSHTHYRVLRKSLRLPLSAKGEALRGLDILHRRIYNKFMRKIHNSDLTKNSQKLRKNMTKEERNLWYNFLKYLSPQFYRQKAIGNYIVDFYCPTAHLVIELDGSQHYELQGEAKDKIRDEYLQSKGLTVIRFSNYELHKNFEGACAHILNFIESMK